MPSKELDLSVVIVSYNVRHYLGECLASLAAACEGLHYEVVVVDNGSSDGSARWVAHQWPMVRLVANPDNRGLARAVNQALPLTCGRYVLVLNPDTMCPPGSLVRLIEAGESQPNVGLLAPLMRDPGDDRCRMPLIRFPSWRDAFFRYTVCRAVRPLFGRARWQPPVDAPTTSGGLLGTCLLVRRKVIDTIGGLDEGYFLHYEDLDYCTRAIKAGWSILVTSGAFVFHHRHGSTAQIPRSQMTLIGLQSLMRFLQTTQPVTTRLARPVFKVLLLVSILFRLVGNALKVVTYSLLRQAAKVEKARDRLGAMRDLLTQFLWPILRL